MSKIYNKDQIISKLSSKETFDLFSKYDIKTVVSFGSITTNNFTEQSDVDLALVADKEIELDNILDIELYLQDILNREIDILDLRSKSLDLFLKINILNTGTTLYSIDNNKTLENIFNETDLLYRENKNFIYFRRLDVLS